MEEKEICDYKLDGGFLKKVMFKILEKPSAKKFTIKSIKLPVSVQVVGTYNNTVYKGWSSYHVLADGEFEMSNCVFMSKQASPEIFSIIKIKKISKLPLNMQTDERLGEIEFDTEVSGEEIGFSLYKNLKQLNMKELMKRKEVIGLRNLEKTFRVTKQEKLTKHLWENRSEKFCDLKFTFDDKNCMGPVIYAHKSVLVAASEVFEAHFEYEGFVDNKSVHIVDSSPHSFNKLLEYIYTGTVQFTTWRLAFDLLYLSKKYLMYDLEDLCRDVIVDFSNYDSDNLLKVYERNQETNDECIQEQIEDTIKDESYEVIHSVSFLNSKFSTIEWLMSFDEQHCCYFLDEWSRLCAIYKWALHNGVTAFCKTIENQTNEPNECLHALLETVRFESIEGHYLQRFLKLPKLTELVDVDELKLSIFDNLLEDSSDLDIGSSYYPSYRDPNLVYLEIDIGNTDERKMKNIQVSRSGIVLGFKMKVEESPDILGNGENSLAIVLWFQYLYNGSGDNKDIKLWVEVNAIYTKGRRNGRNVRNDTYVDMSCRLSQGEWTECELRFEDCRGILSRKIEEFKVNCMDSNKSNIIALTMDISSHLL